MQRITRILLALLLATLAACSDPPPAAAKAVATEKEIPTANPNDDHSREVFCEPSIHPFWKKFRAAVLAEDAEAVADMAEFPLGTSDKDLSRAEFIKWLPQLLKADLIYGHLGVQPQPVSMKELVRAMPTLAKDACAPFEETLHYDRWRFQLRVGGSWQLDLVQTRTFTK